MSSGDIGDFVVSNIQDPVSRTNGVGDFQTFGGAQYAMRIWLDPTKLNNYGLTPVDITNSINAQNIQIASAELSRLPTIFKQQLNATVIGPSRLQTAKQ